VLEEWSPTVEGLMLYYPGRRQVPAPLRALIDMIRSTSRSDPAKRVIKNSSKTEQVALLPASRVD
jgi:hypothetical protein